MKVIELGTEQPTLTELVDWAEHEVVVLRRPDGSLFALSQVDDLSHEADVLKNNAEFMDYLRRCGNEPAAMSLESLRQELSLQP